MKSVIPGRGNTEDVAAVLFETDKGASGSLQVSQISSGRKNRLWFNIDGEQNSVAFDQENPEYLWIGGREENRIIMRGSQDMSARAQGYSVLPAGHSQGYQDCFNAFIADTYSAITHDAIDLVPTFHDGLRAAVITDAVIESSQTHSWVDVPAV